MTPDNQPPTDTENNAQVSTKQSYDKETPKAPASDGDSELSELEDDDVSMEEDGGSDYSKREVENEPKKRKARGAPAKANPKSSSKKAVKAQVPVKDASDDESMLTDLEEAKPGKRTPAKRPTNGGESGSTRKKKVKAEPVGSGELSIKEHLAKRVIDMGCAQLLASATEESAALGLTNKQLRNFLGKGRPLRKTMHERMRDL